MQFLLNWNGCFNMSNYSHIYLCYNQSKLLQNKRPNEKCKFKESRSLRPLFCFVFIVISAAGAVLTSPTWLGYRLSDICWLEESFLAMTYHPGSIPCQVINIIIKSRKEVMMVLCVTMLEIKVVWTHKKVNKENFFSCLLNFHFCNGNLPIKALLWELHSILYPVSFLLLSLIVTLLQSHMV